MKHPFTTKERLTLHGIVQYPGLTAQGVSRETGVNPSTIGTIKKRVKDEGIIQRMYVPNFPALGCELLTVYWGSFRFAPLTREDAKKAGDWMMAALPSMVFGLSTPRDWLLVCIHQNLSGS